MTSDDYSTKPIGSWKPLWRWKDFDGLYLCKSLRYDLSNWDWMERWLKLPLFFEINGGPLFQFWEQEWWVWAWGLFCSSFRKIVAPYLRLFITVLSFFSPQCVKEEENGMGGGWGGHGGRHFYSELLHSLLFCLFFLSGFERKYLTEGAFVCFQMIDLGIWATPLAVQG